MHNQNDLEPLKCIAFKKHLNFRNDFIHKINYKKFTAEKGTASDGTCVRPVQTETLH